jgi:hypothetical protein
MAMTLISPSGNSSVQDDLYFIANSTYSGSTDFRYVFDVYQNDNQLIRTKVYPDPSTKKGYFDAGPVVRNQIIYDWFDTYNSVNSNAVEVAAPSPTDQMGLQFDIRLGYELSGVTYLNQVSGTNTFYNYAPSLYKRKQTDISAYFNRWGTTRKRTKADTGYGLEIFYDFQSKLLIPWFKADANLGGSYTMLMAVNSSSWNTELIANDNKFIQMDVGVDALSRTFGYSLSTLKSANRIDLAFSYNNGDPEHNFKEVLTLTRKCNRYNPVNLYFINALGMFDTAEFNLVSKLSLDTERKSYTKLNKTFNNTSVDYYTDKGGGMIYNESKINYSSKTNWNYKLTMDYPSDDYYVWLAELIMSPQIYAELDGDYYPVTIKNTNYEYNQARVNGLKPLEIEIELNQTRYSFTR